MDKKSPQGSEDSLRWRVWKRIVNAGKTFLSLLRFLKKIVIILLQRGVPLGNDFLHHSRLALTSVLGYKVHLLSALMHYLGSLDFPVTCDT